MAEIEYDEDPKDIIINLDGLMSSQFVTRKLGSVVFRFDDERDIIIPRSTLIKYLKYISELELGNG